MRRLPEKIQLANYPTKIEKLEKLTKELGSVQLYIKRDDQTGSEFSGNKVRKLEYVIKEALDQECDILITCGGIQSNHARATAAAAAKLGLGSYLVLRGNENDVIDGNYFLDKLLGAEIKIINQKDYKHRRMEIMEQIGEELIKKGHKPYIIPEGASNGIGTFGYMDTMKEIIEQEKQLGVKFDAIVVAVGSGGTYGGMFLANKIIGHGADIYGFNVCDDAPYFQERIVNILKEASNYIGESINVSKEEIKIIDGYVGRGYALSSPNEIEFISNLARLEGVILDPVYTGKAMYGLVNEIKEDTLKGHKNVLFVHTGGLFGLFPQRELFF